MPTNVKLAKPFASILIPGLTASAVAADIAFAAGQAPAAVVGYQTGEGPQAIFSGDVAADMEKLQALNFSLRLVADSGIRAQDGLGGDLEFRGLCTGPAYGVMPGGVTRGATIASQISLLDRLTTSIYRYDHAEAFESDQLTKGASWAARIKAATEFLVKTGQRRFTDYSGADRERTLQKHAGNLATGLPLWYKLLDASVATTGSEGLAKLDAGVDASVMINNGIANAILGVLMQPSQRFWNVLEQFCAMFQLVYVPDSGVGYLMNTGDVTRMTPIEKALSPINIDLNSATASLLPLQQVFAYAGSVKQWPTQEESERPEIIAGYPATAAATGIDMDVPMPGWLVAADVLGPYSKPTATAVEEPGISDPLDIDSYSSEVSQVVARTRKAMNKSVQMLLDEFLRNVWADVSLASSTAGFSVPLDLSWSVGKRYTVRDSISQKPLFTGWLASVRHSLRINGSTGSMSGDATSALSFTHVTMGGFTLPGL